MEALAVIGALFFLLVVFAGMPFVIIGTLELLGHDIGFLHALILFIVLQVIMSFLNNVIKNVSK